MKRSLNLSSGLCALLLCGLCTIAAAQVYEQWVARYNAPANLDDVAKSLAVDEVCNLYITGYSWGRGTDYDYATIKYDSSGIEQWVARYNGPGNQHDWAKSLAIDSDGNVYVTGYSEGIGTDYDYATIKYDPTGVELWVARYNGPGNDTDKACSIAVDSDGNVYVTGYSEGSGTDYDYATIKYDSTGVELWVARYNGPGNDFDYAYSIAVDSDGNVYVTGNSMGIGTISDYATVKYDPSGIEQWVARYNGPANWWDAASSLALDSDGNVYVTGDSDGSGTLCDYATIKYDTNGLELWIARYDGPVNEQDLAQSLAVDEVSNVYVTGRSVGIGTTFDYATIKYDPAGVEQWVARYNGPGYFPYNSDYAKQVAFDAEGNVYVTGDSQGSGTSYDYATIKYDQNGIEQWVVRYNGPENSLDEANALAIDTEGNVCVTGYSEGSGTDYDYTTIRYIQSYNLYLIINLVPFSIPIQIPASGGSFDFNLSLCNNDTSLVTFSAWTDITLPNSTIYGPVIGPLELTLPGGGSIYRDRTQMVPANAPAGMYSYNAYAVVGADTSTDAFRFTKLGSGGMWGLAGWLSTGESFVGEDIGGGQAPGLPDRYALYGAYPNPFNAATTIRFGLPEAGKVNLTIHDLLGREVATLVDGIREAGWQEVTFEANDFPSGVYIYQISTKDYRYTRKTVLVK